MQPEEIEAALDRAELAPSLRGTGFWPAVAAMRADRSLAERYADRAAVIDRRAFEAGVRLRVPARVGLAALAIGTLVGFALIAGAYVYGWGVLCGFDSPCTAELVPSLVFLAGFAAVLVCTHCLVHWVVGRVVGIRFTHVFLGGPPPPRPGLKTDYATYLRATPLGRAMMHASAPIFTKLVPFAFLVPLVEVYFGWNWLTVLLLVVGVGQILTDVFLSTKVSDWMKVRRELRAMSRGRSTS